MTELEKLINDMLETKAPTGKIGKTLSTVKKTLNSSSSIVEAVNSISENLDNNIKEGVGGVTGNVIGLMAGKTVKIGGGIAGGIVAGALKTVAGIIPDSSDLKLPEMDKKIAHCIDTYSLPTDKESLFELLQYSWGFINSSSSPFGKQAQSAMNKLHSRVHSTLKIIGKDDHELIALSNSYAPKKRLGLF